MSPSIKTPSLCCGFLLFLRFPVSGFLFLALQDTQVFVQPIEPFFPETAVGLQPGVQLLERLGSQLIDTPIGAGMHFDKPGVAKNAEMLGYLRLLKPESFGYFAYSKRTVSQKLDNV